MQREAASFCRGPLFCIQRAGAASSQGIEVALVVVRWTAVSAPRSGYEGAEPAAQVRGFAKSIPAVTRASGGLGAEG